MNTVDKFFCGECGTDREIADAVTPITEGEGLCVYCNKDLLVELGKGCREVPIDVMVARNSPRVSNDQ